MINMVTIRESFHLFTTTVLSLLLPLSFLLVARLSTLYYHYSSFASNFPRWSLILLLETNPIFLHALVSVVALATFIQCGLTLTGAIFRTLGKCHKVEPDEDVPVAIFCPRLYAAWIFICTMQVCVGLGLEGSIAAGIDGMDISVIRSDEFGSRMIFVSQFLFFIGLHETMIQWCKMIVKPVVDDTVFGSVREHEDKTVEKVVLAFSCGALWWWKLRDEVETAIRTMCELKSFKDMRLADLLGWCLYYVTVSIGVMKVLTSCVQFAMILTRVRNQPHPHPASGHGPVSTCNCDDIVHKV